MIVFIVPPSFVHTRLEEAEPAEDSTVALAPGMLRLRFSEPVDPRLATLTVTVDGGAAAELTEIEQGEVEQVLVASVPASLPAGVWTVRWQVAGVDGHPVTGDYTFTVERPRPPPVEAADTAAPVAADPGVPFQPEEDMLTVESPAWIAARWITFVAMLSVIGAAGFQYLVLRPVRPRLPAVDEVLDVAAVMGARLGRGAALFLALSAGVRLLLQAETLGGVESGLMGILLFETSWGFAWWVGLAGAIIALVGFQLAALGRASGWPIAALAALPVALGASLSSHAAASNLATIAVTADALHVLAVSGWLGTLLILAGVGIPVVLAGDPRMGKFSAAAGLVSTFSPRALALAGIVVVTGAFGAFLHLPEVAALWQTAYGRALSVKLLLVLVVATFGAWNWRRMKPALDAGAEPSRIRRTATAELVAGALVLLATAVLVATPTP